MPYVRVFPERSPALSQAKGVFDDCDITARQTAWEQGKTVRALEDRKVSYKRWKKEGRNGNCREGHRSVFISTSLRETNTTIDAFLGQPVRSIYPQ